MQQPAAVPSSDMEAIAITASRIMIVDDEPGNLDVLTRALRRQGYQNVIATTDPRQLAELCDRSLPDLVLLDLHMPLMNGFDALASIQRHIERAGYLPVVFLTGDLSPEVRHRALRRGAMDFLTKPFDLVEIQARIQNLLHARSLHVQLEAQKASLERKVTERTKELEAARLEALHRLAVAVEFRDDETGLHTRRVGNLAARLARELGLSAEYVDLLHRAAPLHDVGKIAIADAILLKPGPLSAAEIAVMRTHTTVGGQILGGSSSTLFQMAEEIALTHHERWDGSGYPHGLAGAECPLPGRIVAVADYLDALTNDRPYRRALPRAEVLADIRAQAGSLFDPAIVAALMAGEAAQDSASSR